MMLRSHLQYPACECVHSYLISTCQTPFWNTSLATGTKQWTTPKLKKNSVHIGTWCPLLSRVGTGTVPKFQSGYLKEGCVHISAQQVPYLGTVPGLQAGVNATYGSYKLFLDQRLRTFPRLKERLRKWLRNRKHRQKYYTYMEVFSGRSCKERDWREQS